MPTRLSGLWNNLDPVNLRILDGGLEYDIESAVGNVHVGGKGLMRAKSGKWPGTKACKLLNFSVFSGRIALTEVAQRY